MPRRNSLHDLTQLLGLAAQPTVVRLLGDGKAQKGRISRLEDDIKLWRRMNMEVWWVA